MSATADKRPAASASTTDRGTRLRRLGRRFLRRPMAVAGAIGVVIVVFVALFAPWIAPYDPTAPDYMALFAPPFSSGHWLGTDDLGRDVASRLIIGTRASLTAGVLATLFALIAAVPFGLLAGYYRGWTDVIIARANDVVLAFPFLILAVGLAAILGPSLLNATLALAIAQFPQFLRIARGEALGLREMDYVRAAIVNGAPDRSIMLGHLLPNQINPLLIQATVSIPVSIIGAAVLSFLGLGVQPPTPAWGAMLSAAQAYMSQAWWYAVFPGAAIAFTTLAFNLFGDGLRDILDVRTQS